MSFCYNALKSSVFFNRVILKNLEKQGFTDLTPSFLTLFAHLAESEPMSVTSLANLLGVSRQAMHKSVSTLERLGYIWLEMRPENRKEKIVMLTENGKRLVACALEIIALTEKKMAALLGPDAYQTFIENQQKLTRFLEEI